MLLQKILIQLDGELGRLHALRAVVASLSKSPAIVRTLGPKLSQLLQVKQKEQPEAVVKAPAALRRRGRPRRALTSAPTAEPVQKPKPKLREASSRERSRKVVSRSRPAEITALTKAASTGPVVVSAAALAAERATRITAKKETTKLPTEPELRPEVFAREVAARWLTPAKG